MRERWAGYGRRESDERRKDGSSRTVGTVYSESEGPRQYFSHSLPPLSYLQGIPELSVPEDLHLLEADIIKLFRLPPKAYTDASHLALVIVHRMDYLLTWNCTHLANAVLQKELMEYCGYHHLHIPVICTPETLIPRDE